MRFGLLAFTSILLTSAAIPATSSSESATVQQTVFKPDTKAIPHAMTLEDALKAAYINNPELKEARQNVFASHEDTVQAAAGFRPTVDLQGSMTGSQSINSGNQKSGDNTSAPISGSTSNKRSGGVVLRQNLYQGGGTLATLEVADHNIKGLWAQLAALEQRLFLGVIQTYLELAAKKSEIEQLEANKQALKRNYESAQEKHRIGEETITQVANAEAKLADADARLQVALAQHEGLKAKFLQITGIQPTAALAPISLPSGLPADLESATITAKDKNPDVIQAQYAHAAKQAETEQIGSGLLPKIDMQASSTRDETLGKTTPTGYSNTLNSRDFQTNNQLMVSASIPLYEGGSIRSKKRQAHEVAVAKRVAVEKTRLQVVEQLVEAWQNMLSAKNNIDNYEKQVKACEISLEGTQQEMNVGTKVLLDVLNAQAALLDAKLSKINAVKSYQYAVFQVLSLMGFLNAQNLKLAVDYFNPQAHYEETRYKF